MISVRREAGKHGWRSECYPRHPLRYRHQTFSVGIFRWMPRAKRTDTKPGPVLVRVVGLCRQPDRVDRLVEEIIAQLDEGRYDGPKRVRVQE